MSHEANLEVVRVWPGDVEPSFVHRIQRIRQTAWQAALAETRSAEDIQRWLGGTKPDDLARVGTELKHVARRGRLVVATTPGGDVVGYASAINEVSPLPGIADTRVEAVKNFAIRSRKWLDHMVQPVARPDIPSKVYAKLFQVAVNHNYWGKAIGAELAHAAYSGFRGSQVPTAYVFGEDQTAMDRTQAWGYHLEPADQISTIKYSYFGYEQPPVEQWRFAADSVYDLRLSLRDYIAERK